MLHSTAGTSTHVTIGGSIWFCSLYLWTEFRVLLSLPTSNSQGETKRIPSIIIRYHDGKRLVFWPLPTFARAKAIPLLLTLSKSSAPRSPNTGTYGLVSISSIFAPQLEVLMVDVPQATSPLLFGRLLLAINMGPQARY